MPIHGHGNKGSGRGGGAQAISERGKDVIKKTESRIRVAGKGQARSSPISEDGEDKELLNSICQLHRQIKDDHTPAKDINSAIRELRTEIQSLIGELDDSEENTAAQKQSAKSKHGDRNATASGTNESNDLHTLATMTRDKCIKLDASLLKTRKDLKKISELAVAVGQEVGFQPDTSNTDQGSLSLNAKEALEDIKRMNRELSEELNKLRKNIESYSTDKTERQPKPLKDKNQQLNRTRQPTPKPRSPSQSKKAKDQAEENKVHKSSQFDTNIEIISKAVSSFEDLQQYKGKLNKQLDNLREKITTHPTYLNVQQQPGQKQHKEGNPQNSTQKSTTTTKQVKGERENKEDQKEESREAQNEASGQISSFQIVFEAVEYVGYLQDCKIKMDPLVKQIIDMSIKEGDIPDQDIPVLSQLKKAIGDIQMKLEKIRHLESENSKYKQTLKHVWKTTTTAANHVTELARNNTGPGKFQVLAEGVVQSETIDQFNQHVVHMIKDIEELVERDARNGEEMQKLKREIERRVKENDALQNRLSKMAGNKMTEGNPNIANLGDPNRPTKIAEIYSEIYDNEWTDVLDLCHKELGKNYKEDEALQALNYTLIICYKICQEKSDEWIKKTKGVLTRCSDELMVDIQSEEFLMQIIEGRKAVSDQMSAKLLKEVRPKRELVPARYGKEMSSKLYKTIIQNKFFDKCFTLCWKMIVQNPQMILMEGPPRGQKYDRNIFREFTSSGSKVVFTVWPALYLHADGPLLIKGVLKVE